MIAGVSPARPLVAARVARGRRPRPAAALRRPQQRSVETRQRILEAAVGAFAQHGFDGALTRDIAEAAGVQQPLINYHFGSKLGLWQACVSMLFDELRRELADIPRRAADLSPEATLRATLRTLVRFNALRPELNGIIVKEAAVHTERLAWAIDAHVAPTYEGLLALLREVQATGALAPIAPAALYYLIVGAASSVFIMAPAYRMLSADDPFAAARVDAYADAVEQLFLGTVPGRGSRRARCRQGVQA